jgi:tRNA threonylcarbamoyladenosine biosynthesis protein TsaB
VSVAEDWLLAIDTSSEVASLALAPVGAGHGLPGAELTWQAGRAQTTTLLTQVDRLLRLCEIDSSALSVVAIATGPGGFNALRVGMSVAKGFAFALDIPIIGVGTLELAAQAVAAWGCETPVRAFVGAGRGRVVSADFSWLGGRLTQRGEMTNRAFGELADGLGEPTALAGELLEREAAALRSQPRVVLPGPAARRRRAGSLLDLAAQRWRDGEWDDLVTLEPIYVHATSRAGDEPVTAATLPMPGTTL